MMFRLDWALVVATYNRAAILARCIELAIGQDRPPAEIVVIDASDDWAETRDAIARRAAAAGIRYVHRPAAEKSLTVQRNQGVALATAPIVFLIDDDSLMHPGCAAAIMAVYEADRDGVVAGVQAMLSDEVPGGAVAGEVRKAAGAGETGPGGGQGVLDRLRRWVWRELFLMDGERLFLPYDGHWHERRLPSTIAALPVTPVRLFHGCRMTFRREVVVAEPFDGLLRSYCPGEDLDGSYRASRHGLLLAALTARLHHFQSAGGRVNRYRVALLSVLNQAVLVRRHSRDLSARAVELRRLMRRRSVAELLKDLLSRRLSLPQFRGLRAGARRIDALLAMDDAALERAYPEIQGEALRA